MPGVRSEADLDLTIAPMTALGYDYAKAKCEFIQAVKVMAQAERGG
jgi:hypothetical protein